MEYNVANKIKIMIFVLLVEGFMYTPLWIWISGKSKCQENTLTTETDYWQRVARKQSRIFGIWKWVKLLMSNTTLLKQLKKDAENDLDIWRGWEVKGLKQNNYTVVECGG